LGPDVYNRGVPNYKLFATIQTLFNDWRDTGVPDINRIANYEKKLQEHLMQPVQEVEQLQESSDPSHDVLVVKLMAEKLNKRYGKCLNPLQRSLLSMYAFEGVSDKLSDSMHSIKDTTLQLLESYGNELRAKGDTFSLNKLHEVKNTIEKLDPQSMDDTIVARFLKLCELKEELEQ
jgi:hypothetical protein